ncbi:hypothetical protein PoB_004295300 [Plakobranchus ocellatus]|uniref:Uncharacterized protein n=1 Tax=Plakobranchus ocellatus TaxID=259542 RepID=A0AAV4BA22_9GAST|nr:hypothetical protein PoB_004295300 [Plakobranchus ocellatus]
MWSVIPKKFLWRILKQRARCCLGPRSLQHFAQSSGISTSIFWFTRALHRSHSRWECFQIGKDSFTLWNLRDGIESVGFSLTQLVLMAEIKLFSQKSLPSSSISSSLNILGRTFNFSDSSSPVRQVSFVGNPKPMLKLDSKSWLSLTYETSRSASSMRQYILFTFKSAGR